MVRAIKQIREKTAHWDICSLQDAKYLILRDIGVHEKSFRKEFIVDIGVLDVVGNPDVNGLMSERWEPCFHV